MCQDKRNGPDWTDIRSALKSVEETHHCSCGLALEPFGRHDGVEWCIILTAQPQNPLDAEKLPIVVVQAQWPRTGFRYLEGAVYDALYKLDVALLRSWYTQAPLPW